MHENVLASHPSAHLKVLAVWFNMLVGDSRQFLDTRALGDPRVTYFWDQDRLVGRWFSDHVTGGDGITWDGSLVPASRNTEPHKLYLYPTGGGEQRAIDLGDLRAGFGGKIERDGQTVEIAFREALMHLKRYAVTPKS